MVGWIKYENEIMKVNVLEDKPSYKVVETENNELLCIPAESGTVVWPTEKECREKECNPLHWVPMGR